VLLTGCKSRRKLTDLEDPKKRTGQYVCPAGPGKYFCECVYIYKDGMVALFRLVTFMAASAARTAMSKIFKERMDMSTLCQVNPEVISPNYEVQMLARFTDGWVQRWSDRRVSKQERYDIGAKALLLRKADVRAPVHKLPANLDQLQDGDRTANYVLVRRTSYIRDLFSACAVQGVELKPGQEVCSMLVRTDISVCSTCCCKSKGGLVTSDVRTLLMGPRESSVSKHGDYANSHVDKGDRDAAEVTTLLHDVGCGPVCQAVLTVNVAARDMNGKQNPEPPEPWVEKRRFNSTDKTHVGGQCKDTFMPNPDLDTSLKGITNTRHDCHSCSGWFNFWDTWTRFFVGIQRAILIRQYTQSPPPIKSQIAPLGLDPVVDSVFGGGGMCIVP